MDALKELAKIIQEHRLEQIDMLGSGPAGDARINAFYEGLLNDQFANDDEAAKHFFEADRNHSSYQLLKSKTKSTLLNHVFSMDYRLTTAD